MPIKAYYEIEEQMRDLMSKLSRAEQKDLLETLLDDYEDAGTE